MTNTFDPQSIPLEQRRKIWGRRQIRPLKTTQKKLLEDLYPTIQVTVNPGTPIDPSLILPDYKEYHLEIGFGGGEHLSWRAQNNPTIGYLGCEPFMTGVASLLGNIHDHTLKNIRIVNDDARLLARALPEACLNRIYILFPDPWHKKRHNKRRIVHDETIADFSRILKPGGELFLATDITDYGEWMQDVLSKRPEFTMTLGNRTSLHERPEPWPLTKYEQKGIAAGRQAIFLVYKKAK